jgi:gliding motility-associated-like protein
MVVNSFSKALRMLICALFLTTGFSAFSQADPAPAKAHPSNPYGVSDAEWTKYLNKTNLLSEKVDVKSFLNYVVFSNDGNFYDMDYFMDYIKAKLKRDRLELIYRVGKGTITTAEEITNYYAALQPKYNDYYLDFKKRRDEIVQAGSWRAPSTGVFPTPSNCGSPCTNPGFEAGTGFWDYYTGTACASSTSDPCSIVAGFSSSQHVLQAVGGSDPVVGAALPVVPPGGGSSSLMLGDGPITGGYASRASISFTVSAANANFTYRYACVLQDPGSSHTDPERPYFNVHLRDGAGNLIGCGEYMAMAKPPIVGFTETSPGSTIWWRGWTTVLVPLSSYIGQCVTVQFTSSDCAQGGHYGYAYIDGDCDPLAILSSSPSICGGGSVTLTAPTGAAGYSWTNTAGGTTGIVGSTTGSTCVVNVAGTYQVVITSAAGASCTTTLQITVGSSPTSPVASFTNTTVCAGTAMSFTDTSTPGGTITSWSWDFNGDGTPDATTQNPSYTFAAGGTYSVTLTISNGACNATVTQNVTVTSGTPPTITPAGPFCATAASVNLTGSPAGGTWSGTGITSASLGTFDPSTATIGNNTVTYTVTGGCGGSSTATVVVNANPVTTVNSATVCPSTTATLTAGGATTYLWSTGSSANPITVSPASTTSYTVTGTTAGCTSSAVATVTIGGSLFPTVNSPTICAGATATLTATGGTSYTWSAGATSTGVNTVDATPASTSTYTVTATTGGCSGTAVATVTVNALPVLNITNPAGVCTPGTVDITIPAVTAGSTGGGTLSYWTDAAATIPLATPAAVGTAGTYYVESTTSGGCTDVAPVTVTINPLPVSNAGPDITICTGGTGNLGAPAVAGDTYSWALAAGLSSTSISDPTVSLINGGTTSTTTTYTVTTTTTATGCTSTDMVTVTVDAVATANAGSPQSACVGGTITLAGSVGGSASGGTWSGGTGTYSPNNTTLNAVYTPSAAEYAAGTVTLTLTTNDPTGPCTFASSNVTFTFFPSPVIAFTVDDPNGCPIHCANFTDNTTVAGGSIVAWSWDFGDGTAPDLNQNPSHCFPVTAGFYDVSLTTTTSSGCVSTLVMPDYIQVYPEPNADFTPSPQPASVLDPVVTLNNGSSSDVISWWYYFGDGDSIGPGVPSPVHVYPDAASQTYMATLYVQNGYGCVDSAMRPVEIGPEFTFFIPNAFTPNGDGVNDYFYGQGIGIIKYELLIFDRWGNEIFKANDLNEKWDGRANGGSEIAQQDVYVWKVRLTDVFEKKHAYIGTVTIVK